MMGGNATPRRGQDISVTMPGAAGDAVRKAEEEKKEAARTNEIEKVGKLLSQNMTDLDTAKKDIAALKENVKKLIGALDNAKIDIPGIPRNDGVGAW